MMMTESLAQASVIGHLRIRYVTWLKESGFKSNPLNTDTPILRTLCMVPSVSELTGFDCNEESVSSGYPFNPLSPKRDQHQISPCDIIVCKTGWSWELRTWSHKMNLLDILSTSPHYFCRKCKGATNENSNLILGFKGIKCQLYFYCSISSMSLPTQGQTR